MFPQRSGGFSDMLPSHAPTADAHFNQHSWRGSAPVRLPQYKWKCSPLSSTGIPPHDGPAVSGHKRRLDHHVPQQGKRQRLDPAPHAPPTPPPPDVWLRPVPLPGPSPGPAPSAFPASERQNGRQSLSTDKLSSQMLGLFEACQQQPSDLEWKEVCRVRLQEDIRQMFPAARLYLTGSSISGLGCRSSDADLCLVLRGIKIHNVIRVLADLQAMFKNLPYISKTTLIRAKVPILKFKDRSSDLEFDLNINNTVGIRNTFLLRSYAFADPRVRPLVIVIKKWAQHKQINNACAGTLSSYTLVLMTLHYLQILEKPVLPSLQEDFPDCFNPFLEVDQVPEGAKRVPVYVSRNSSSLGELLLGFLRYYATHFRWDKQVISVRQAKTFPKTSSRGWSDKFIGVEEPFERNNVARAVHKKDKFDAITAQFVQSYRRLEVTKDLNSILPLSH